MQQCSSYQTLTKFLEENQQWLVEKKNKVGLLDGTNDNHIKMIKEMNYLLK